MSNPTPSANLAVEAITAFRAGNELEKVEAFSRAYDDAAAKDAASPLAGETGRRALVASLVLIAAKALDEMDSLDRDGAGEEWLRRHAAQFLADTEAMRPPDEEGGRQD